MLCCQDPMDIICKYGGHLLYGEQSSHGTIVKLILKEYIRNCLGCFDAMTEWRNKKEALGKFEILKVYEIKVNFENLTKEIKRVSKKWVLRVFLECK